MCTRPIKRKNMYTWLGHSRYLTRSKWRLGKMRYNSLDLHNLCGWFKLVVVETSAGSRILSPVVKFLVILGKSEVASNYKKCLHDRVVVPRNAMTVGEDVLYRAGNGYGAGIEADQYVAIAMWCETFSFFSNGPYRPYCTIPDTALLTLHQRPRLRLQRLDALSSLITWCIHGGWIWI